MNKIEFISAISTKTGLTKKDTKAVIDAALETITETLAKKDSVSFIGFGTFSVKARNARTAKVPGTDKTVDVPATTVAKFKAGSNLRTKVASK